MTGIPLIIGTRQHMQHLSLRQPFITNPSRSIGVKKSLYLFFKFPGQFHNFRDARTKYQNPGPSLTIWDVCHYFSQLCRLWIQIPLHRNMQFDFF